MEKIQVDITKINANKFIVGNEELTYLELMMYLGDLIAGGESDE